MRAGEMAPDFTLPTHDGGTFTLSAMRGRRCLLWFYLEADTPGCSLEGRGFRDHQSYFDECAIALAGISFDDPERNAAFARRYDFGFPLLSDTDRAVAIAYGACDDPKARQPRRVSFLIDAEGRVERVWEQVDPRDHPARVLAEILG